MEVIAQSLINFAEKHFEDMEEGFVNQILLEVLSNNGCTIILDSYFTPNIDLHSAGLSYS